MPSVDDEVIAAVRLGVEVRFVHQLWSTGTYDVFIEDTHIGSVSNDVRSEVRRIRLARITPLIDNSGLLTEIQSKVFMNLLLDQSVLTGSVSYTKLRK